MTALALAARLGRHSAKVSRIERGQSAPSVADIVAWCQHCQAEEQAPDLVASLETIESMYVEWRLVEQEGMRQVQQSYAQLYQRTRTFRVYEPGVIPGIFQTQAYASARMARIIAFSGIPDDLDAAVSARMQRQRVLQSRQHRFSVVVEEAALRLRIGSVAMMAGQLDHLLTVASLPNVSFGVVPQNIDRSMWSSPGFWMFDDDRVLLETPSAELTITQPGEVALYARTFAELASMAVYGPDVRNLVTVAIRSLDA